jgi:rRNA maturation endonuclease Nob1
MPKTVSVPLDIMIEEHKKTIKALSSSATPKERSDELKKQSSQLKKYEKLNGESMKEKETKKETMKERKSKKSPKNKY